MADLRGALLDLVCHGLRRADGAKVTAPLRDREFENWIEACELPHWGLVAFSTAYEGNVADSYNDLLELDPLLAVFRDYVREIKTFRGTAGQLLQELNGAARIPKGHRWPRNPRALSGRLRHDAKLLLPEIKMEFNIKEGRNRDRLIVADLKLSPESPKKPDGRAKAADKGPGSMAKGKVASAAAGAELPLFSEG